MVTTALDVCIFVVVLEGILSWVQPDVRRWPRYFTHAVTRPALNGLRRLLDGWLPTGMDISPILLIMTLACLKFLWRGVIS